ncbi:hypothetical protein [Nonomuraea gerenzanensis]|uniref:Uncharacterized protein n=1 Tax=Nonomuraea gerenzanensis TaxID=93944 RepID=A0A1M4E9G6_9ACTN|nr:hypothetical protein [Nonomuraea gerenzanensis]UBU17680.1 hypothetical protein LCN96_22435 [Nonomuraea gerenzanensis]SBO95450.1 hypothetical protein BN4615_P4966 [Nonomuraea gerenzanensis]
MSSYDDDTLPLQPPIRLPDRATLAAAVRAAPLAEELKPEGDDTEVLAFWAEHCRERLAEDEGLLLELVRLFLSREPLRGEASATLTGLGLVRQAEPYTLSWLGLWVARQIIAETTGQDIPVMGTLADADAATLLHGLRSYPESERGEELAGWLKDRDEQAAADEIAAVLGTVSPLSRAVGVELLSTAFGEEGRQALGRLMEEPKLGAVIAARTGREERQPSPDEIAWVLVDMAAALLEFGGETGEVIESIAMGMKPEEQAGTIAILAFGDHPWTGQVLRVFIDHHPDERVAAAARKALRRLRGLGDLRG